ncbi:MAG: hypothetical protein ACPGYT_06510 [Nitrospirales bacterium]
MNESGKHSFALKAGDGIHVDFRGTRMTVKVSDEQSEGMLWNITNLLPNFFSVS